MKHNLKTRPNWRNKYYANVDLVGFRDDVTRYFDDFEAELRKRFGRNLALSKEGRAFRQGQIDLAKEILGESHG